MNTPPRATALGFAVALAFACFPAPAHAGQLTTEDFKTATTSGIVALCTAPETDPLHQAAVGYCVGYLTGAYHYHKAVEAVPGQPKLFCTGDHERPRQEEIERFRRSWCATALRCASRARRTRTARAGPWSRWTRCSSAWAMPATKW
jgi:hypothetical protein